MSNLVVLAFNEIITEGEEEGNRSLFLTPLSWPKWQLHQLLVILKMKLKTFMTSGEPSYCSEGKDERSNESGTGFGNAFT